jgi:phosphotransferase system enzyme I (PtsI)
VILARALGIPVVVAVGGALQSIEDDDRLLVNGRTGEIRINPSSQEVEGFHRAVAQATHRREALQELAGRPTATKDGVHTVVQANLDLPHEAAEAARLGADGVGLFRSEFLVIGRREIPGEDEQIQAYRTVLEAFPDREVTLRTFDIGGDKFPLFLALPPEDNPYLGWRAIRICLDMPDLFRNQLRAAIRASDGGNLRLLIPFVSAVEEMQRTRDMLTEVYSSLGIADSGVRNLGKLYDPLHPALIRMYRRVAKDSARHSLDLSVCGELSSDPIGVAALLGLGYRKFSASIKGLPEIRELIRNVSVKDLGKLMRKLDRAESGNDVRRTIARYLDGLGLLPEQTASGLLNE